MEGGYPEGPGGMSMSWSFTVNETMQQYELTEKLTGEMGAVNADYPADMAVALTAAKALGLSSGTLSGFRTPHPYGGPDSIGIAVMGTVEATDWHENVRSVIAAGPDCVHEWDLRSSADPETGGSSVWYGCVKCGHRQGGSVRYAE
jgi:hypothetical protein